MELVCILLDVMVVYLWLLSGLLYCDVIVVILVWNNVFGLWCLVILLCGLCVIVVDDGLVCLVELDDFVGVYCDIEVFYYFYSKGLVVVCNIGLVVCIIDFVVFLDFDVMLWWGWLEFLFGYFCDFIVVFVVFCIVSLVEGENLVVCYEVLYLLLDFG